MNFLELITSFENNRVDWFFIISVLRKMGFPEMWIDKVWQLVSNCWFSVLINGSSCGYFKSSRGLRQGDPLSPSLFILAADALSRSVNNLLTMEGFKPYRMPSSCLRITHLAFADDVILLCSGDIRSLQMLYDCLGKYQKASG